MIGLPSTLSGGAHVSVTEVLRRSFRFKIIQGHVDHLWVSQLSNIMLSLFDLMVTAVLK